MKSNLLKIRGLCISGEEKQKKIINKQNKY